MERPATHAGDSFLAATGTQEYIIRLYEPGNPNAPVGVNGDTDLGAPQFASGAITGAQNGGAMDWPHPADTPQCEGMKRRLVAGPGVTARPPPLDSPRC